MKKLYVVLLLLSTTAVGALAQSRPAFQNVVYRGKLASDKKFESVVMLQNLYPPTKETKGQEGDCSAIVIAENLALTATHCIIEASVTSGTITTIRFANGNDEVIDERPMLDYRMHDGYSPDDKLSPDIALVKFGGKLPDNFKIWPLANEKETFSVNRQVLVAGYGRNDDIYEPELAGPAFGIRRYVEMVIKEVMPNWLLLNDPLAMAGFCPGDSGGPSFVQSGKDLIIIGIHSSTRSPGCGPVMLGRDNRITAYKEWILEKAKELTGKDHPTLFASTPTK